MWRCYNEKSNKCKSCCSTNTDMIELISLPTENNHALPDIKTVELDRIRAACKRKANLTTRATVLTSTMSIDWWWVSIEKGWRQVQSRSLHRLDNYQSEKSNLQIFINNPDTEIILISSKDNLRHLQIATNISADGTVKYSPNFFLSFLHHPCLQRWCVRNLCFLCLARQEGKDIPSHMLSYLKTWNCAVCSFRPRNCGASCS